MKKVILLGAPGAGKGTQAEIISKNFDIPKLSTGDMLRVEIAKKSPLGQKIEKIVNAGEFVSDDIMIQIIESRIAEADCKEGFILDGFPRTYDQCTALDKLLGTAKDLYVIALKVDEEEIITRVSGRYTCKQCGTGYHKNFNRTKHEGICDVCGGKEFVEREDDKPEAVRKRIEVYRQKYTPVIEHYRSIGLLNEFDGMKPIRDVSLEITDFLNNIPSSNKVNKLMGNR